ncbi:MAG: helix-turn-helix domain-containing protein [Planctomycetaceae bacterium]|nr:helix-turn-helix domain-containing protein [Planctomycetaceae bacterium]
MPSYSELIVEFPLRPIRTERQLDQAARLAFQLASRERLTRGEQDYLDVLTHLIELYESQHHPIDHPAPPRALLQFLIDENGLTLSRLATETGIKVSTLSEILHGKRELNVQHIARLAARFRVEPGLFIERVATVA